MNLKPEVWITGLFILFVILIFAYPLTGNGTYNNLLFILIFVAIPLIIIFLLIKAFVKTPKSEIINNFKNQHIITQILIILTIISLIVDFIMNKMITWSSIPFLLAMIAIFCEWFFKKEE